MGEAQRASSVNTPWSLIVAMISNQWFISLPQPDDFRAERLFFIAALPTVDTSPATKTRSRVDAASAKDPLLLKAVEQMNTLYVSLAWDSKRDIERLATAYENNCIDRRIF
jgi:hypothetical protein